METQPAPQEPPMSWGRKDSHTLPPLSALANLTTANGHSPPGEGRDSGNWSMASTHSSFQGPVTLPPIDGPRPLHPTLNQGPQPHSPFSNNAQYNGSQPSLPPTSLPHSPTGIANRSTTSLHQPYQPQHPQQQQVSPSASRRSSFDARLNNLHLNPTDSHTSLPSIMHERGIHNRSPGGDSIGRQSFASSHHTQFGRPSPPAPHSSLSSPVSSSTPERLSVPGRIAPPITGPIGRFSHGLAPHPNAPSPTKGYAYAFPDPDVVTETIPEDSVLHRYGTAQNSDVRRVSTTSLATTASSVYSGQSGHLGVHNGHLSVGQTTPYSRTPELRISHKLAERKRRKEMKNLFDELRDLLPADRGGKSSKWEILTKAIEYIKDLQANTQEGGNLKQENAQLKNEIHMLRQQMQQGGPQHISNQSHSQHYQPMHHSSHSTHSGSSHSTIHSIHTNHNQQTPTSQGRMQGIEHY